MTRSDLAPARGVHGSVVHLRVKGNTMAVCGTTRLRPYPSTDADPITITNCGTCLARLYRAGLLQWRKTP